MRTNSISHSKIPKLNLNFNHSTKNSTYVKKKPLNNLKYDFNGRNNLQKSHNFGYSTMAEFKKQKVPYKKKYY